MDYFVVFKIYLKAKRAELVDSGELDPNISRSERLSKEPSLSLKTRCKAICLGIYAPPTSPPPPRLPPIDSRGIYRSQKNMVVQFGRQNFDLPSILCCFRLDHGSSTRFTKITIFSPIRPNCHSDFSTRLSTCVY